MGKDKKKHKKKSLKHKKKKYESESDSSSSSEEEWVEAKPTIPSTSVPVSGKSQEEKQDKRIDNEKDWLMNPAIFACISKDEMTKNREKKNDKKEDDKYMLDKLGQTDRELNPYWKDGGSGLPQEERQVVPESLRQASVTVGDQGVAWLRKALQRAKEQAVEQGRSLEQVVAERWGSLEKLQGMIAEAEEREKSTSGSMNKTSSKYRNDTSKSNEKFDVRHSKNYDRDWSKNSRYNENKKDFNYKNNEGKTERNERSNEDRKQNYSNTKNHSKSFKKPKGSESDSSDYHYNDKHMKSSGEQKKNDRSSEKGFKYDPKNKIKDDKDSKKKNNNNTNKRSSSISSEDEDSSSESDESNEEGSKRYKYKKRYSKKDNISKSKKYKKRYDSSLSSSSDDERKRKYNRDSYDKKTKLSDRNSKGAKRTFIKPHHDSDDDSFTSSNQKYSEKTKLYSSSSSKGWRKKTHSPRKEEIDLCDMKEECEVKELRETHEEPPIPKVEKPQVLTDKEMNDLGAKLVKAELLGNQELASELKAKLESAREAKANAPKEKEVTEQVVILTHTDSKGFTRPVSLSGSMESSGGRRKAKKVETHAGGKRMRYFADDDKYTLQEMFQREKLSTVEDSNAVFANLASKGVGRNDSARDMDDVFEETARMKVDEGRKHARDKQQAIEQSKRTARSLENCQWCLESKQMLKHLIVAMGQTCYLCVPPYQSLTEHHCLLVPSHHTPCTTQLDEDVWREMQDFRKSIVQMFLSQDEDVLFFESARYLGKFPHMVINCVPMPKETGDLAPIYFKKAIQECEMEWSNNKKLVELKGRDVRRAVPRGLPYFAVDFGMENGFAHVIEDEKLFPQNFAQEIIGGMLDLDHTIWRKQRRQTFEEQSKKVIQLSKLWSQFDCTRKNE